MGKRGPKSKFTTELLETIFNKIINGVTVLAALEDLGIQYGSFAWFLCNRASQETLDAYARAKEKSATVWAAKGMALVEDQSRDMLENTTTRTLKNGDVVEGKEKKSDNTAVNRDRLRFNAIQWYCGVLDRATFGDKVEQNVKAEIKNINVIDRPKKETPEEWQERIKRQLAEKAKALVTSQVH